MSHAAAATERKGVLLVIAAALLWSTGGVAIKSVDAGPLVISFYRSSVAAVVLFAFMRPKIPKFTPGFAAAVFSYAACLTTFVMATKWTTAANAIFLQYTGVFWVMLLSPLVLREPLHRRDLIAVAVAFAGMGLFFVDEFDPEGWKGILAAVASSLFFAGLILFLRLERDASAEAAVSWGNVLVALALLPLVAGDLRVDGRSFLFLVFLGVFQIGLAYVFFVRGLRWVSATQASLTGMIEPVMNPIWVFFALGERPAPTALLGGLIVLAAVGVRAAFPGVPKPAVPPPD